MTDIEIAWKALGNRYDKVALHVLADAYADIGDADMETTLRWMANQNRFPWRATNGWWWGGRKGSMCVLPESFRNLIAEDPRGKKTPDSGWGPAFYTFPTLAIAIDALAIAMKAIRKDRVEKKQLKIDLHEVLKKAKRVAK